MPDHGQRTGAQFLHAACPVQKFQEFTQTTGDLHCDSSLRGVRAGPVWTLTQRTLLDLAVITPTVAPCLPGAPPAHRREIDSAGAEYAEEAKAPAEGIALVSINRALLRTLTTHHQGIRP